VPLFPQDSAPPIVRRSTNPQDAHFVFLTVILPGFSWKRRLRAHSAIGDSKTNESPLISTPQAKQIDFVRLFTAMPSNSGKGAGARESGGNVVCTRSRNGKCHGL
jgi:hypothetical protein